MPWTAGQKARARGFGGLHSAAQYNSNAGQSIPNSVDTKVLFTTPNVTSDLVTQATSGAGHKFTLEVSGIWSVQATVRFPATATGERFARLTNSLGLTHHACSAPGSASSSATLLLSICKYLAAGDFVCVEMFQNSGGSITTDSNALAAYGRIDITGILLDDD